MKDLTTNTAPTRGAQARWEVRRWMRASGLATLTLLLLTGVAVCLHLGAKQVRRETVGSQAELQRFRTLSRTHNQSGQLPELQLKQFQQQFPLDVASANQALAQLFKLAKAANLSLENGDYGIPAEMGEGLSRYTISLPVVGDYGSIQQFCGQALLALPTLALDGVQFSRNKVSDAQVEATLNFSFYFRSLP